MDNNKFYTNILKEIKTAPVEKEEISVSAEGVSPEVSTDVAPETANDIVEQIEVVAPATEPESDASYNYDVSAMTQDSSFIQKLGTTLSEGHVFGGLIIYVLFIVNLIGTTIFARKASLGVTQSILYKFHIDTIAFVDYTFLEINILISYIFAFICGGFLIFAFLKIGSLIAKTAGLLYSHRVTRLLMAGFMALYMIIALGFIIAGNSILSIPVYNWAMPLLAFAGGFCMYCVSLRNVNIY